LESSTTATVVSTSTERATPLVVGDICLFSFAMQSISSSETSDALVSGGELQRFTSLSLVSFICVGISSFIVVLSRVLVDSSAVKK
jgi:hypothetical protein